MSYIIMRLIPKEPTSGADFTEFLTGLTITAFDISFGNLEGVMIGQAGYVSPEGAPHIPNPETAIVQHFDEYKVSNLDL